MKVKNTVKDESRIAITELQRLLGEMTFEGIETESQIRGYINNRIEELGGEMTSEQYHNEAVETHRTESELF